jgi:hypothetical protein
MTTNTLPTLQTSLVERPELHMCDRCGAQGKFLVVLINGLDLVFCSHHTHEYAENVHGVESVIELT